MSETKKKVAVIMGSDSDAAVVAPAVKRLRGCGVQTEVRVISAHRTPDAAVELARSARDNGFGVIICAAGMAAHLAGIIAGNTTLPVIGIPVKGAVLDGMDALLSTVMMPPGVPVATVAVNGADNAAILALQILGVSDPEIAARLDSMKNDMAEKTFAKDAGIEDKLAGLI